MDRRFNDLESPDFDRETTDEVRGTDWIIGLLSALVLAIVLYAAVFGLNRNDQMAATAPTQGVFSLAQLIDMPVAKPKDAAR